MPLTGEVELLQIRNTLMAVTIQVHWNKSIASR